MSNLLHIPGARFVMTEQRGVVSRLRRLLQSFDFQLRQSTQLMYSIYSRGNFTSMPLP